MQNPSVVLYGPHNAKVEEKPIPELASPHDVLIRINYVGVCGSDVRLPRFPFSMIQTLFFSFLLPCTLMLPMRNNGKKKRTS